MKLSVKSDYAVRAVLGLSLSYGSGKAVRVEKLANDHNIPANYLVQILLELKNHGLVSSQRGKDGGYLLAKPPEDISWGDVIRCIHGPIFEPPSQSDSKSNPVITASWEKLQNALDQTANSLTFDKLVADSESDQEMYYI